MYIVKKASFIFLIIFFSCTKNSGKKIEIKTCNPIKSIVYSFGGSPLDSVNYITENNKISKLDNLSGAVIKFEYSGNKLITKEFIHTFNGAIINNLLFQFEYDGNNNLIRERTFIKTPSNGNLAPYALKEFEVDPDGLVKKMIYKEDNFLLGNFIFKSGYSFIPDGKGNYSVVNSLNENGTIRSTFQLTYDNNVNKFPAIDNNYHAIDQIDLLLYNILLFKSKNYLKEIVIPGSNTTSYETVLNESGYATQIKRNGLPFLKYTYDCK